MESKEFTPGKKNFSHLDLGQVFCVDKMEELQCKVLTLSPFFTLNFSPPISSLHILFLELSKWQT
jgi:hypothetical protein